MVSVLSRMGGLICRERTHRSQTLQAQSSASYLSEESEENLKRKSAKGRRDIPAIQPDKDQRRKEPGELSSQLCAPSHSPAGLTAVPSIMGDSHV